MKTHLIIDFMHLVHRAKYVKQYLSIKLDKSQITAYETDNTQSGIYNISLLGKEFQYTGSPNGVIDEYYTALNTSNLAFRTTTVYMVLKLIENSIKQFDNADVTICFDSKKNKRKETSDSYKSNRVHQWLLDDYSDVQLIEHILGLAEYNCLKLQGYEADDLVYWANKQYKDKYEQTIILTNDMDLVYNIDGRSKLFIRRTKDKAYKLVDESNADTICKESYGIEMPYSSIMLYKSLVGDTSDNIKGVTGYGKKTFEKMIKTLDVDYKSLLDWENVKEVIGKIGLSDIKYQQAIDALEMVKPQPIDLSVITEPHPIDQKHKLEIYKELGITNV